MTNPNAAVRMLITYAVVISLAILVGYLLTNPLDYGTLGFLGIILAIIISPVFIKWHYPIMVFGLACPAVCFFLPGRPPMSQIVVIMSLSIAITERILRSQKRFISVPVMTWPLLFLTATIYMTAELNGGIGLHALGGGAGGGRKYIEVFIGIATYFALTSQTIPHHRHKLYLMLFFLPALLGIVSDLFPFLPSPLNTINLLFPPHMKMDQEVVIGTTRLTSLSFSMGTIMCYLLARYGLSGTFSAQNPWRGLVFLAAFALQMLGGFRNLFGGMVLTLMLMFFFERLYRTRLLPVAILACILGATVLAAFSDQLPYTFQRSMSFLPLKWKAEVLVDAEGSSEWRYRIWRATWPKVPDNLLLGKGYVITKEDYDMIGQGTFANIQASHIDAAEESLAISSDYHSGPLSTLMPFGVWGAIGIVWLMGATLFVLYRNYKYGDPSLQNFNIYMFATCIGSVIIFFFVFGAFNNAMGAYGGMAGFSLAMNGGLGQRPVRPASNPAIKPLPARPAPQMARGIS